MPKDENAILYGDFAAATFKTMNRLFADLLPVTAKAEAYARSSSPILIESSAGLELELLAQSIHNAGNRKSKPFIITSISGMDEEQQEQLLFGNMRLGQHGAILDANQGTLMIQGIDKLTLPLQSQLARIIRLRRIPSQSDLSKYKHVDIRIIASTSKNLTELRKNFLFRSDLLFALKALRLRIPPLKDRPNDILNMLEFYFNDYNIKYRTHHSLSENAKNMILHYSWQGNVAQLQAFCERMILTAEHRVISSAYIEQLLHELYIEDSGIYDFAYSDTGSPEAANIVNDRINSLEIKTDTDPYKDLIIQTLRKFHGNRKLTAKDLHISTTTLWRKIRKYGIDSV